MIKKILMFFSSLALFGALVVPAYASAPWNVTGNYEITFLLNGDVSNTPYVHHMALSQSGATVTGDGGYPATGGDTYHWNITSGTQTGDSLNLTALYDLGATGTTMHMVGTIASDGTVTGTWDDNFGGTRTGSWSITKGVSVPRIHTPANGATVNQSSMVKIDWTDSVGSNPPFLYEYQAFSDAGYTTLVYDSLMTLTASEIPTPGTPPGDYYVRVKAQNSLSAQSDWSNGAGNVYKITVVADPVLVGPPIHKDECKNDGWKTFNNPTFKNQGKCIDYVEKHDKQIKGDVKYDANGLMRHAEFEMNTADNKGTFEYEDANHDHYKVKVSNVSVNGNFGYFAGVVTKASNPAWVGLWLFAKVEDNSPDKVWGSFTSMANANNGVNNMTDPSDGPFNVLFGNLKIN